MEIPHSKYINSQIIPDELLILISMINDDSFISMLAIPYVSRYWSNHSDKIPVSLAKRRLAHQTLSHNDQLKLPYSRVRLFGKNSRLTYYYSYGKLHRDNNPATFQVVGNTTSHDYLNIQEYYQHGVLHREDGPARIVVRGKPGGVFDILNESYLNGQKVATIHPKIIKGSIEHCIEFNPNGY